MKMFLSQLTLIAINQWLGVDSEQIKTYFLNKDYDLRNLPCNACNKDVECVKTEGKLRVSPTLTLCMRIYPMLFNNPVYKWSTSASFGTLNDDRSDYEEGIFYGLWDTGPWIFTKTKEDESYGWIGLGPKALDTHMWHHTCLSMDMTNGEIKLVENGNLSYEGVSDTLPSFYKKLSPTLETAAPGCVWRPAGSGYMSVFGRVTDFNIFGRVLSLDTMKEITGCKRRLGGDIVNWEKDKWELVGSKNISEMEELDFEKDVCVYQESSMHLIPLKKKFDPWMDHTCSKLSSRAATYDNKEEFQRIARFLAKSNFRNSACASSLKTANGYKMEAVLGTNDNEVEGVWRHNHNDKKLSYLDWLPNRPYPGGTAYNCLAVSSKMEATNGSWSEVTEAKVADNECIFPLCGICQVDFPVRKIYARGLCEVSMFDTVYMYTNDKDGNTMFFGRSTSFLIFSEEKDMWLWYDRQSNESMATSKSTRDSLLLGVNNFEFGGVIQDACAKEGEPTLKKIKFTTCVENQFTCNDGQCIDIEQRCDQTPNCLDESDEDDCRMIFQKDNYKKTVPPFSYDAPTKTNIPVNVNVSFSIKDMLKIEEIDHIFVLKYTMIMEWYDFRLTYYNLKTVRSANSLASTEIERIWIPFVVFENTENNEATVGSKNTEVTITREGEFEISDPSIMEEINIFKGANNRITFQEVYTKTFKCEYQLQMYPFDKQRCTVVMIVRELERSTMMITPDKIMMEGETVLTQYIIPFWSLDYVNASAPSEGISMVIILKRRIMNEIMTTYLPTILILIIVYVTNFFKAFFFEAVVTVNLTALLVLTTLFISVSGALPPTAYVKMIDVWLIFAQLVPFFEVLLHTFMDNMRVEGDREINHHGKKVKIGKDGKPIHDEDDSESSTLFSRSTSKTMLMSGGRVSPRVDVKSNLQFNKTEPWPEVKLQTTYKGEEVGDLRDVRLIARNEREEVDARKEFYENTINDVYWIKFGEFTARVLIPCFVLSFAAIYWGYGLSQYMGDF